jgi:glycosyltransferase A (GT-A) superfamily protein (DUF2064 family)
VAAFLLSVSAWTASALAPRTIDSDETGKPAIIIGMDAPGLLDTMIIDCRRAELRVRMRDGTSKALL